MPRFRKKPVEIAAMHFSAYLCALPGESELHDLYRWLTSGGADFYLDQVEPGPAFLMIRTLEGTMRADVGDWIICGVQGEFYPCKPDIFEATYEPVESSLHA